MKLHLPSRLRKALLSCLAPVLSLSAISWSSALVPAGAFCLFAAAAWGDPITIGGGEWSVSAGVMYGGAANEAKPYNTDSEFIFDAGGTTDQEQLIQLTLQNSLNVKTVTVAEGTRVVVQAPFGVTTTFRTSEAMNLNGTIEYVASDDEVAPGLAFSAGQGLDNVVEGENAKIVLNFTGRRHSLLGLDLNNLFKDEAYIYTGSIELQGVSFGLRKDTALVDTWDDPRKKGSIIVDGGAQFQLGSLRAGTNTALPEDSISCTPYVLTGDVILRGSTSEMTMISGTPGWVLRCGALRMLPESRLDGDLHLEANSNILVYATSYNPGGGVIDCPGVSYIDGRIIGNSRVLTLTGAGTLEVGPAERLGVMNLEDLQASAIVVSKNGEGNYANRGSGRRFPILKISERATKEDPFEVEGLTSTRHEASTTSGLGEVTGSGWMRIYGRGTYAYDEMFSGGELNLLVAAEADTMLQRFSYTFDPMTLQITRGTVELSSSSSATLYDISRSIGELIMSDKGADGTPVVSELRVTTGLTLQIWKGVDMSEGGRVVVKGQVNSSPSGTPDVPRTNLARLELGSNGFAYHDTEGNSMWKEMTGVIELDQYSELYVWGEDVNDRPTNGWNISVVHETAKAFSVMDRGQNEPLYSAAVPLVLCKFDRLNLNNNTAGFGVRMKDGGYLINARNFASSVEIQFTGEEEEDVVYHMGGYGQNGSINLGKIVRSDTEHYGRLQDLYRLNISNKAELDFSGVGDMTGKEALFNFTGNGELVFSEGEDGKLGTLTLKNLEAGQQGKFIAHYHLSNKEISGWRKGVGVSYYDAVLRGVGFDFDGFEEEGYGTGWLTVTDKVTPSNIYVSTRDNDEDNWGWNPGGNPYESTSGVRAVCVDKETRFDLSSTERGEEEDQEFKRGLILPNLVGKGEGNLVITGNRAAYKEPDRRSLVTFSNRIDQGEMKTVSEETGVTVNPDFYYDGSINISDADLAIRHVKKAVEEPGNEQPSTPELPVEEPAPDLEPPEKDSSTIVTGNLNLSGGALLMQSGVLEIKGKGGSARLEGGVSDRRIGIQFAEEHTSQMRITEGAAVEVGGEIGLEKFWDGEDIAKDDQYAQDAPHILMAGGASLDLLDGATVKDGVIIGNQNLTWDNEEATAAQKTRNLPGTLNVRGTVSTEGSVQLRNVALCLQDKAVLLDPNDASGAVDWELNGLDGSGKLESNRGLEFNLAGRDHVFTGDLATYTGKMTIGESGKYTQSFDGVLGSKDWSVDVHSGAQVSFSISKRGNKLDMGDVSLEKGSKASFLLDLNSEGLKDEVTVKEGFFFRSLAIGGGSDSVLEVGQDNGVAVLQSVVTRAGEGEDGQTKVRQYIGRIGDEDHPFSAAEAKTYRAQSDGVALKNILNVKDGTGEVIVDESGNIYIQGELDARNKYVDLANGGNSNAGAELFSPIYSASAGIVIKEDLGNAMQALNNMLNVNDTGSGDKTAGSHLLASVAGSSTSVLAPALGADMERNLRSIRNRTTGMGMDDAYEYEDLSHTSFWVNAEVSYLNRSDDELLPGYKSNAYGGTLGVAHNISTRSTIGLALSAMYQNVTSDNVDNMDADFTTAYLNLFAVTQRGSWRHTFIASAGVTNAKMDRRVSWVDKEEAGGYSTSGSTNGTSFGAMYEVGYAFAMNGDQSTVLQPVFNLQWHNASLSSYEEEGSTAGLRVDPGSYSVVEVGLGARLQMIVGESVYNRASLLETRALLKFYAGDDNGESSVGLKADTTGHSATVEGASEGRVGIEVGAGLSIPLENRAEFFFDAGAEIRSSFLDFNATAGLKFNF